MATIKPREEKSLKIIAEPKTIIAQEAPCKKDIILSKKSFCIGKAF